MKLSDAKVNVVKLEEGGWVDNIPELEGLRLKVRGAGNRQWRRLMQQLINAIPRKKRHAGVIDPAEMDRVMAIVLRDACLDDWDGLEGDDGKPLPYSKEKACELLADPAYAKFRDGVTWAANAVAEQEAADTDSDAKN